MERAVSRSELVSPESTPEPASNPELLHRLKNAADFEYVAHPPLTREIVAVDEDALDFRLFSSAKPTEGDAVKIRLRSPTPQTTEPGFVVSNRPSSYYFAHGSDPERLRYQESALSGSDILALSRIPHPGCSYAWKVLHLHFSAQIGAESQHSVLFPKLALPLVEGGEKRKRLGKKARIKVRMKHAAARAQSEKAKADAAAKEIAKKERRARKNREKKLKKRAKGRMKKAGAVVGDEEALGIDGNSGDED